MKKVRVIVIASIFMIVGFIMGACGSAVMANQTYPLKIWKENRNCQMETWKVVDDDTGVNYIVVAPSWKEGGYSYDGICITTRLNADGSPYTSK